MSEQTNATSLKDTDKNVCATDSQPQQKTDTDKNVCATDSAPADQGTQIDPADASEASSPVENTAPVEHTKSVLRHAKVIGALTFLSRILGLAREVVAGHYLGTGPIASAFTVAFTIPNLFRKLLGEGALSAAFIPLYAQAQKRGTTESGESAGDFASASVKLLAMILIGITLVGEAVLLFLFWKWRHGSRPDRYLMVQFAAIMLPYVMLVCGGAFLGAILQVHKRFGPPAFAPVLLNVCHIVVVVAAAWMLGLHGRDVVTPQVMHKQIVLAIALAVTVLVAGALQVAVLLPALREIGFRFRPGIAFWTASTKTMLRLSLPVALGAGVLQISVLLDKSISYALMQGYSRSGQLIDSFQIGSNTIRYPMEIGATRRLDLAQLLYQFPLGVFAIALATAIFPSLSAEALTKDRDNFKRVLRNGIEATLWEGFPASVGLILVADPAVRLLFRHGQISEHDAALIVKSTMIYASAIWSFSMLQVINRAYYAIHDSYTPLVASILNIIVNLVVEIPLLWTSLGESAMAVGTLASFAIQAVVMLWMLDRRVGGLDMKQSAGRVMRMLLATAIMGAVLYGFKQTRYYPTGSSQLIWIAQLVTLTGIGATVYIGCCELLGANIFKRT